MTYSGRFGSSNSAAARQAGRLVINADDWGRSLETTAKILDCVRYGSVSAVSAMVFMEDSERAAEVALALDIDVGLHLNLTTPFSSRESSTRLTEHHNRLVGYFSRSRFNRAIFNPLLADSFRYVVRCQLDEFERLYGRAACRVDGHHHMHLCSNVIVQRLLPYGALVRRNLSFEPGEKGRLNILYRTFVDRILAKRHTLHDFFFSLVPLQPRDRLENIISLASQHAVEIETHPINAAEYAFLMADDVPVLTAKFHLPFPLLVVKRQGIASRV